MADSDPDKDHELPDFVELELPAAEMSASSDALIGIGKVFDRGKVHGKDLSFRHTQGKVCPTGSALVLVCAIGCTLVATYQWAAN